MPHYHIQTFGCQMNRAESARLAGWLRGWGFGEVASPEAADVVVVNACVVRQRAEERAVARIRALESLKRHRSGTILAVTGCLVPPQDGGLRERFPDVDLFLPAGDLSGLEGWGARLGLAGHPLPAATGPSAFLPIIQGCHNRCSYCIVPSRRGPERSRSPDEVVAEAREMVRHGAGEVVLLGQSVNAYGRDLAGGVDLAGLLRQLNAVEGLRRIRFLTSYPMDITDSFLHTVASLDRVCPAFSLPVQAGDDAILAAMGRRYTAAQYRGVVAHIRQALPEAGIATDVIVGFPGESREQFERTVSLVAEVGFDAVHIAGYSPRPGTPAARSLRDDVPSGEKKWRQQRLEAVQREVAARASARQVGQGVEVLVEEVTAEGQGRGRTPSGRLVFFPAAQDTVGQEVVVRVEQASPWWLTGTLKGGNGNR
ncbi:MAG: MiaB/RimO family radical SAM methylthiotransferase [Chloroflexota bacterium]